jgi:hypothetical protein
MIDRLSDGFRAEIRELSTRRKTKPPPLPTPRMGRGDRPRIPRASSGERISETPSSGRTSRRLRGEAPSADLLMSDDPERLGRALRSGAEQQHRPESHGHEEEAREASDDGDGEGSVTSISHADADAADCSADAANESDGGAASETAGADGNTDHTAPGQDGMDVGNEESVEGQGERTEDEDPAGEDVAQDIDIELESAALERLLELFVANTRGYSVDDLLRVRAEGMRAADAFKDRVDRRERYALMWL